ncbi:dynein regulatory complex protein 9 isoform X1 [Misgurnus anguillicaudatus]|uniref:dynein regulatory complex protein 9 isoform X1 n=2 Tax=Misgurnus anguillicaudatus TaxID=75329 RepID=UPI003CCF0A71
MWQSNGLDSAALTTDVIWSCAVLQDCADQLSVLDNIMRPGADTRSIRKFNLKTAEQGLKDGSSLSDIRSQEQLRFESPLTPADLVKVQVDRQFVSEVINGLIVELWEKNTFQSLFSAVEEERKIKAQLLDILMRDEERRIRIKTLQKQLLDICKEKTEECERLKESIAHLRHQVENTRMKTECQRTFVKSCTQQLVCQGQKTNSHIEKELEDEVMMTVKKTKEEEKVSMESEAFLKSQHAGLQEQMQYWTTRYEKDLETKEQELTALRNKKANNLAQLHELSKKCRDMQQVIIEDRRQKEEMRVQLETEQRERDAAIKIQSWWRGTVVRRGLGSPKKADKSKPKKGKKKKK